MTFDSSMIFSTHKRHNGMMALIGVIMLATGALAFSLATASAAVIYSDMVSRHEMRIQARLNAESCLATAELLIAKDYFLEGPVILSDFGCEVDVSNDLLGHYRIGATAHVSDVTWREYRDIYLPPL